MTMPMTTMGRIYCNADFLCLLVDRGGNDWERHCVLHLAFALF